MLRLPTTPLFPPVPSWGWEPVPSDRRPWIFSFVQRKYYEWWSTDWRLSAAERFLKVWLTPPVAERDLDFTAFALDQWTERTRRVGARLVVLSTQMMRVLSEDAFDRLAAMAKARDIPLVDQYDYIVRKGGIPRDASWRQDIHWNPQGHQWAAEAMIERLARNVEACGR